MSTATQWLLKPDAIEHYAQILVPTILGPYARALVESVNLHPGTTVLDVGCGTGAATRFAAQHVGNGGRVIGVDIDPEMIRAAMSTPSVRGATIEWHQATAYHLPVPDQAIDVALCAQVLQFLNDRSRALCEIHRVLEPAGRLALSVWSKLEDNPFWFHLVQTVGKYLGQDTAAGLSTDFALAEHGEIEQLLSDVGFKEIYVIVKRLDLRLPGVERHVPKHISATPFAAAFNTAPRSAQAAIADEMSERLAAFQLEGGLLIPFSSNLAIARKN